MASFYGGAVNDLKITKDENNDYIIEQNGQTTEGSVHIPVISFNKNENGEYELYLDDELINKFFIPTVVVNQENKLEINTKVLE